MEPGWEHLLTVEPQPGALAACRRAVEELFRASGVPADEVNAVKVALSEAVALLMWLDGAERSAPIDVAVRSEGPRLELAVRRPAPGALPPAILAVASDTSEETEADRLRVQVMRGLVDEATISQRGDVLTLTLTKTLAPWRAR